MVDFPDHVRLPEGILTSGLPLGIPKPLVRIVFFCETKRHTVGYPQFYHTPLKKKCINLGNGDQNYCTIFRGQNFNTSFLDSYLRGCETVNNGK